MLSRLVSTTTIMRITLQMTIEHTPSGGLDPLVLLGWLYNRIATSEDGGSTVLTMKEGSLNLVIVRFDLMII